MNGTYFTDKQKQKIEFIEKEFKKNWPTEKIEINSRDMDKIIIIKLGSIIFLELLPYDKFNITINNSLLSDHKIIIQILENVLNL